MPRQNRSRKTPDVALVISQLARKGLAAEPSFDLKNGVPVFRVGDSPERIPGDRAAEILAKDD
jgi:hypothetical protein